MAMEHCVPLKWSNNKIPLCVSLSRHWTCTYPWLYYVFQMVWIVHKYWAMKAMPSGISWMCHVRCSPTKALPTSIQWSAPARMVWAAAWIRWVAMYPKVSRSDQQLTIVFFFFSSTYQYHYKKYRTHTDLLEMLISYPKYNSNSWKTNEFGRSKSLIRMLIKVVVVCYNSNNNNNNNNSNSTNQRMQIIHETKVVY